MKQAPIRAAAWLLAIPRFLWRIVRRHPVLIAFLVPTLAAVAAATAGALYIAALVPLTPDVADAMKAKSEHPTVVLSADGRQLAVFRRADRRWVKLSDISPQVVAALIATEDHRFFEHKGLDLQRIAAAAWQSFGGNLQGGSTLTQQLARNLYPEEIGRSATLDRKLKEAITALKLEDMYSKDEILETYLNTVPFLYNAYGIEMAARTYFDKTAGQLDALESATLIGMLKGTSYYNPVLNPERAVQRRNTVLAQMVRHGKLEAASLEAMKKQPLGLDFERQAEDLGVAPHLTQQLRRWLISWADRRGYNIYADGLVVRTTIDSHLQSLATEALTRQADKLQAIADKAWGRRMGSSKELVQAFVRETAQYKAAVEAGMNDGQALNKVQADADFMRRLWQGKTTLQAAFLAIEPGNGHVKAWVGSRDFQQDQFDHVQQARRQPGSTFKPFVYGAAFDQGISPSEMLIDEAMEYRVDDKVWKPTDMQQATGQPLTLREGLVQSKNTITAQLIQRVGAGRVAQVAQAMGVRESKLDAVPSLALGTSPVTLKEMVSAYGTIANSGGYVEPALVTSVTSREGTVLEQFTAKAPEQSLSSAAAQTLQDLMRGVIDQGTGTPIRKRFGIKGDLAGKTGTTQNNTDGWFILMHPQLVSGAWVGFNDNRITMGDSWGQGAHNALNIVGDFFQQTLKAKAVDAKARFPAPRNQGLVDPEERMNFWLNTVAQSQPQMLQEGQVVIVPPAVAGRPWQEPAPAPQQAMPYSQATPYAQPLPRPESEWYPERQRAPAYSRGPALPPPPDGERGERQHGPTRIVIVPPSAPPDARRGQNDEYQWRAAQPRADQHPHPGGPAAFDERVPRTLGNGGGRWGE